VHGTQSSRFAEAEHSPYPVGHERERINKAFTELITMVRQELAPVHEHTAQPRPKAA